MQFRKEQHVIQGEIDFLRAMLVRLISITLLCGLSFVGVAWCEQHLMR